MGLSEAVARAAGLDVRAGSAPVPVSSRGFIHGPGNDGLIELVSDAGRGVLVGATAVGLAAAREEVARGEVSTTAEVLAALAERQRHSA